MKSRKTEEKAASGAAGSSVATALKYKNEEDRAYGLAGMAIAAASLDSIERVDFVSLDSEGPMVTFSSEFYYPSSQAASPKFTWKRLLENYQLASTMAVSNVLSRRYVHERTQEVDDMLSPLRDVIALEGKEICALDADEVEQIFDSVLTFSRRIFGNRRLLPLIDEFAGIIARRRTLTGREIAEELSLLRML